MTLTACSPATHPNPETTYVTITSYVDADGNAAAAPGTRDASTAPSAEPSDQPAIQEASGFALDPAYADKVGGDCGYTPDGFAIRVGLDTSCAFAAEVYPRALAATYSWTNNPNVTSVPKAILSVPSPVTGQTYELSCSVGSDRLALSCMGDGNSPLVSFEDPNRGWDSRITIM